MTDDFDKPTEITREDIEKCFNEMMKSEIREKTCLSCGKKFYLDSYGHGFGECDECYFSRWPKKAREAFFRSFFE